MSQGVEFSTTGSSVGEDVVEQDSVVSVSDMFLCLWVRGGEVVVEETANRSRKLLLSMVRDRS